MDERGVTFSTKGGATATLAPQEFIRRFLLHVLPRGFVKIRHFGLLAPGNVDGRLAVARRLLEPQPDHGTSLAAVPAIAALVTMAADTGEPPPVPAWRDLFLKLTGIDLAHCRLCGRGTIISQPLPPGLSLPAPSAAPPLLDTS